MVASRLSIYNGALLILGERRLASLSENREPRRLLDDVWDNNGVRNCLQAGQWNFAVRTVEIAYNAAIEPDFGYSRAFTKPDDVVRLIGIDTSGSFSHPFADYVDEAGFWWTDHDTIYVRYISDDDEYGLNFSLWTPAFTEFVEAHFAWKISPKLTGSMSREKEYRDGRKQKLVEAQSLDAMDEGSKALPHGALVQARMGRFSRYGER